MATVFDVARYIVEQDGATSMWKLQKLCYYAQAWHLAWTENPIFDENFEAWSNGPCCSILFYANQEKYIIHDTDLSVGNRYHLTDDEKDSINVVLRYYGEMKPYELRELSRSEDPWKYARGNLSDGMKCSTVITKESMERYYSNL